MQYSTDIKLSPFTITVGGETFDIPTYPVSEKDIPDLLEMKEGEKKTIDGIFVQRGWGTWFERWFCCDDENMFSLRLVR